MSSPPPRSKAERRAVRQRIGAYHAAELAGLLAHLRSAFDEYEAGRIDPFGLDDIIHDCHRAAQKLYDLCVGSSADADRALRTLEWLHSEGNDLALWEEATSDRRS